MQERNIAKTQLINGSLGAVVLILMILEFGKGNDLPAFVDVACLVNCAILFLSIHNLRFSSSTESTNVSGRANLRVPVIRGFVVLAFAVIFSLVTL
jgi:hypothetical protein